MRFFEIGIAIFVVSVVLSRLMLQKANKRLTVVDKAKLVDLSGGLNSYAILIVLPLVAIYWYLARYTDLSPRALSYGYFAVAIFLIVFLQAENYRKVTKLEFPRPYVSAFIVSRGVYLMGVLVLFAALVVGF